MQILKLLSVAVLVAGCATFDDTSYMPSEKQLEWTDPHLLNCPAGTVATCDSIGGARVGKKYLNCRCARRPFRR